LQKESQIESLLTDQAEKEAKIALLSTTLDEKDETIRALEEALLQEYVQELSIKLGRNKELEEKEEMI
jgi:hypothetical protein